jgi:hypothetical protein
VKLDFKSPPYQARDFDAYIVQYGVNTENYDLRATTPLPSWVGGTSLVGNREGQCTACHTGANVFINHPGSATDISPTRAMLADGLSNPLASGHANFWFPSNWPNPIVPNHDPAIGGPWPQNPGPSSYQASAFPGTTCLPCHGTGTGGAFPAIGGLNAPSFAMNYVSGVLLPATTRSITPPGPASGAMPPGTATAVHSSDAFPKAMIYQPGGITPTPLTQPNGLPSSATGRSVHKSANVSGVHQHYFWGGSMPNTPAPASPFNADDILCFDAFASSGQTPQEVMIQFLADGNWEHRAFWGPDLIGPPAGLPPAANLSPANFQVSINPLAGGMPGVWQPFCTTAAKLNLAGKFATGLAFTLQNGSLYWGDVYRYVNGSGSAQMLFSVSGTAPPSGLSYATVGGDSWQVMTTPVP